ncbi:uncharacterized protein Z518_07142 [Rhinocladiella mackenziei CBS 650.93]|uniref:Rhinocladiella mackenziei CBS 650.93 unplaced genomic scaffold supercont1.5, whole genome shotgun sequence n=1 Tax=Rhinocladiella mackenziei CBS 650.93 TaxID=1442369 RepID=A0A0D2ICL9_9EURO|nr:uncharacterized protein Z518_07142 [Rhinocladiella mackenziei CBS 650.93]KIX03589.1 hypothetical protein Z518_07142 [Rhinocladiella mackenziei CBS 650.93]
MPKKHQQKALLTKPQSSTPNTLSLSKSSTSKQSELAQQRTVNELIRESRRLQIRNEFRRPPPSSNTGSIPPALRVVLDIPPPQPPAPRLGDRATGPNRLRRVPGPPPPRSWLTDSIHAPAAVRTALTSASENENRRVLIRTSHLPDCTFPPPQSLQHLLLKNIARDWAWHAKHDEDYLGVLPTKLKETLLSYLAVYNEVSINPLRILFLSSESEAEDRAEVRRLDLSNGLGAWTTLKQLERDLVIKQQTPPLTPSDSSSMMATTVEASSSSSTPDSWDADDDGNEPTSPSFKKGPKTGPTFVNLKHLSLAISPGNATAASWASLLSLAAELQTLTSLSLAYWPQPTFTPNAASTRAVIRTPSARPVVYGGSDIYTPYDSNWREAAGILRTLSRSLYCLKWLDLTGCGDWFAALQWTPSATGSYSHETLGPEWNGGWRGLERLVLEVGWRPIPPEAESRPADPDESSWNVENERKVYRHNKERERFAEIRRTAQSVARYLRASRKDRGGIWVEVDLGEDLAALG